MWQNKKRPLQKGLLALCALILIIGVAAGCGKKEEGDTAAPAGSPGEVLVTYKDGGKVTREEFNKFLNVNMMFNQQYAQYKEEPAFQQDMMNQLVAFNVLASRADDKAKEQAEKQSKEQLEQIKGFMGMQEGGMEKLLTDNHVTEQDLNEFVQKSIQVFVSEENKVADPKLQAAYDEKLAQDKSAYDIATVSHILIGTSDPATGQETRTKEEALQRAKEVQDKLVKGGDFAALAKEYSEDPGSKDNGGQYADAPLTQWVPEFKKAASELPIGQISEPVETSFGYHVMKVEARKTKTFDEVKQELRSELAQYNVQEFMEKELPTLIETNNLPKQEEPKPAETPGAEAPKTDAPQTETGK
ncbi:MULTISPECIES: peptidylprolyl isomerase [unclassified Paenibacillus]|uniref:peptidylprolyl isomerase n=1 Tax=unclassified Paenibacillus TaxID=185978 RepID=UPI001AE6A2E2|nr:MULTISPECIES: peptidylprolyl isomerase [unclassified Paenibacillus]MBP1153484.1 foldase protein PrsA [Paenibacillus sp. PvP091]MBP1171133.1 foldase protein PrsA [Paenibacillus sp. PvR098]MBP2442161.1 foldase protein PrsA [Paenibacillus sp. PvP052]